jgi:hypothetical protein
MSPTPRPAGTESIAEPAALYRTGQFQGIVKIESGRQLRRG